MLSSGFFHLLFVGITFFQCLFILVQLYIYKRKEYRFYFLYILSMTVYLYLRLENEIGFTRFTQNHSIAAHLLNIPLNFFAFWMYIVFGKHFIQKHHLQKIKSQILFIESTLITGIMVFVAITPFKVSYSTQSSIFIPFAFFVFVQGMAIFVKLFRQKDPLNNFLLAGGILIAVGGFFGVILSVFVPRQGLDNPVIFYGLEIGVILELLLLNTGLVYKTTFIEKKVNAAQQELISELQKNEQLQNKIMEADRQIAEVQMAALSAQMNPHFIFNCMNSIQKYVLRNEKEKAITFLQHFSELMRCVLESSTKNKVGLDEEINMLEKYLLLEQQRLNNKFSYVINISPGLQTDFFEIPGMLIQPYVENAIWHGMMNLPDDAAGKIELSFERENGYIKCEVLDNGVGRKRAAEMELQKSSRHKSHGMAIAQKRMELLQKEHIPLPEIRITDLHTAGGLPAGTRISIYLHAE
ncbi:MAG: histidine kinase [Ferruginibacter sp.]